MLIYRFAPTAIGAVLAATLMAGCSGVGEGSRPETLKILQLAPGEALSRDLLEAPTEPAEAFTCVRTALSLFVTFSGGDIGNFTNRARWSSSNEAVVRVSNRDETVPGSDGDLVFDFGSLTPVAPGTATITAEYVGKTASIPVTVEGLDTSTITIEPASAVMAPRSVQDFRVSALIDGVVTDISNVVTFAFAEPDEEVAIVSGTGRVRAVAAGTAPLTLEGRLNAPCEVTPSAPVQVATLQALDLDYEEGFDSGELLSGTTQLLRATGQFGDLDGDGQADTQDLSSQSVLTSSDTGVLSPGGLLSDFNLVIAITSGEVPSLVGDATVTVNFGRVIDPDDDGPVEGDPGVESNALPFTVFNTQLQSLRITPEEVQTLAPLDSTRFRAIGTYTFDGVEREQDVTRHVAWQSSDTELVQIVTGVVRGAGMAQAPTQDGEGSVTISASFVLGVADVDAQGVANPNRPVDDPDDLRDSVELIVVAAGAQTNP